MVKGVDISNFQGNVDFNALKTSVSFAIIRLGWGSDDTSQDDVKAQEYMNACESVGLPYGVYLYSYALNDNDIQSEIAHVKRVLGSHKATMGIWFDFEDADHYKANHGLPLCVENKATFTKFCVDFCNGVKGLSDIVGVYASDSVFKSYLDLSALSGLKLWVANWGSNDGSVPSYQPSGYGNNFILWQYTSNGSVNGIGGRVDMNISFIDVPTPAPAPTPTPTPTPTTNHKVGETVSFNAIYTSSTSTNALTPAVTSGVITKVIEGANNPYLINDGTGWVNDGCIVGGSPAPAPTPTPSPSTSHNVGDYVHFNKIYVSSTSTDALTPAVTEGTITQINAGTNNPYLINGGTGWINDSCITSGGVTPAPTPAPAPSISVGSNIMIRNGATDMNTGDTYGDWVYNTVYQVKEISGNRVVFGNDSGITGATDIANCYLV